MSIQRSGIPAIADVVGQYRLHCDTIADGEQPRPVTSLLIEHHADGGYAVITFGMADASPREKVSNVGDVLKALGTALQVMNAATGH